MSAVYKTLTDDKDSKKGADSKDSFKNRQRVLLITSRGVTQRHRHFVADLFRMLPHARKEPKFDRKAEPKLLNDVADMYNCNNILYFEARKHQDLYMWLAKAPNGPTAKFLVQNLHTMDVLNFTGNCLRGSRPILSFDKSFDNSTHFRLVKEMLLHTFGVPPRARKSKPFVDHVLSFSIADDKIWARNYQISEESTSNDESSELTLVEIGPRFVLTLISILEGSFAGAVLYENKQYVSPNAVRSQERAQAASEARSRSEAAAARRLKQRDLVIDEDPLAANRLWKN